MEQSVEVMHGRGGESSVEFTGIEELDMLGSKFRKWNSAKAGDEVHAYVVAVASPRTAPNLRFGNLYPDFQKLANCLTLIEDRQSTVNFMLYLDHTSRHF